MAVSMFKQFALSLLLITLLFSCKQAIEDELENFVPPRVTSPECTPEQFIPLSYTIEFDHIALETSNAPLKTSIHPWGASTPLHTGHFQGDMKSNWKGLFAYETSDQTYLSGGNGPPCDFGEVCGVPTAEIENRLPKYISTDDNFKIMSVRKLKNNTEPEKSFNDSSYWIIDATVCNYQYTLQHLRAPTPELCMLMVEAGNQNPCTYSGALNVELAINKFKVPKNTPLAVPQVLAQKIDAHPGYWSGRAGDPSFVVSDSPWAQIEFNLKYHHHDFSLFSYFNENVRDAFKSAMFNATLTSSDYSPDLSIYGGTSIGELKWMWMADMRLESTVEVEYDSRYNTITEGLSDWWEYNGDACIKGDIMCNDVFFITPISKDPGIYDSSLYQSVDSSYIVHRQTSDTAGNPLLEAHWGEIVEPETLAGTSGQMIIKWRLDNTFTIAPRFQGVSYYIDPSTKIMKVKFASEFSNQDNVILPSIPGRNSVCDGVTLKCYESNRPHIFKTHYDL